MTVWARRPVSLDACPRWLPDWRPGNFVSLANERHHLAREEPRRVSWTRRWGEDGVGSDPPPDDMRLAGYALFAVARCHCAIVIPGHLEHARMSSHPLDAQARRNGRSATARWDECLGDHLRNRACCCRVRFFQSRSKRGRVSNVGIRNPPRRACPGGRTCPRPAHVPSPGQPRCLHRLRAPQPATAA